MSQTAKIWSIQSILSPSPVEFDIAPANLTITPKARTTYAETTGGNVVMPHLGQYGNYTRIDFTFKGVSNVYYPKAPRDNKAEEKNWFDTALEAVEGVMGKAADWTKEMDALLTSNAPKDKTKIPPATTLQEFKDTSKKKKANILQLYQAINAAWYKEENGAVKHNIWTLTFATPLLGVISFNREIITLNGYPTSPMTISENVNTPNMPNWEFTFSIFDKEVEKYYQNIENTIIQKLTNIQKSIEEAQK